MGNTNSGKQTTIFIVNCYDKKVFVKCDSERGRLVTLDGRHKVTVGEPVQLTVMSKKIVNANLGVRYKYTSDTKRVHNMIEPGFTPISPGYYLPFDVDCSACSTSHVYITIYYIGDRRDEFICQNFVTRTGKSFLIDRNGQLVAATDEDIRRFRRSQASRVAMQAREERQMSEMAIQERQEMQRSEMAMQERQERQKSEMTKQERREMQRSEMAMQERQERQKSEMTKQERRERQKSEMAMQERQEMQRSEMAMQERQERQKSEMAKQERQEIMQRSEMAMQERQEMQRSEMAMQERQERQKSEMTKQERREQQTLIVSFQEIQEQEKILRDIEERQGRHNNLRDIQKRQEQQRIVSDTQENQELQTILGDILERQEQQAILRDIRERQEQQTTSSDTQERQEQQECTNAKAIKVNKDSGITTKDANSSSKYLLVAAFDFGTTYSGYALSFRDNPTDIQTNQEWSSGSDRLISLKTPTCVLLRPNGQFHSFGYDAENKYANLAENDEHHGWRLFRRFKIFLHNNEGLTRESTVEDINGKSFRAMEIFSLSIGFLRDHMLQAVTMQKTSVKETDILYVITVPSIWNDNAKQFMREAAVAAGLYSQRVKLALESEAASIWCLTRNTSSISDVGSRYMVVDLGGGTVDISVHETKSDGSLKDIHYASGGPWGGTVVDNNYFEWLTKVFGQTTINKFKKEQMGDFYDVQRVFELKKRTIAPDTQGKVTFRVPLSLIEIFQEVEGTDFKGNVAALGLSQQVSLTSDKLRIDSSVVKDWFEKSIQRTVDHINDLLREPKTRHVNKILLVGGFAECKIVQTMLAEQLQNKTLIVPNEAGLAVLKGAVLFGHMPEIISSRIMKYTYGVSTRMYYDEDCPFESGIEYDDEGLPTIPHVFDKFVSIGQEVPINHEITRRYIPSSVQYNESIKVYSSTDPDPHFTTDQGCNKLGVLEIYISNDLTPLDNENDVTLIFGETEILVRAKIIRTGREFFKRIDCL